jgi:predicted amidohydrolase
MNPASELKIALASPRLSTSFEDGLEKVRKFVAASSGAGASVVCFPEAYLPGLRGHDFDVWNYTEAHQERVLKEAAGWAREFKITTILSMEKIVRNGRQIVAVVFDERGNRQGFQTKNQIDPSEDRFYVAGTTRQMFQADGVKFGISICHEGWRYPETVRWAAVRGARIVFHPQHTGYEQKGTKLEVWGSAQAPYYEQAMAMRARENTIYFASVNYALRFQESATSLIDPSGECQAFLPYGQEGILVQTIDLEKATGLLASRFAPERYRDA